MKLNLVRTIGAIAGLVTVLTLTGCASESGTSPGKDSGAVSQEEAPDKPIEVKPLLISNGFKETRVLPIMTDSAYWVAPFATAMELELDGNATTGGCIFRFTREDYKSGPLDSYRFSTHNNVARITVRTLDPLGAMGTDLPQVVTMPIEELTPQSLKKAFTDSLPQCGDTTLR